MFRWLFWGDGDRTGCSNIVSNFYVCQWYCFALKILEWCCLFSLGHDHFINEILKFPLTSLGPPSLLGLKVQNFVFLDKEFRLKELGFQGFACPIKRATLFRWLFWGDGDRTGCSNIVSNFYVCQWYCFALKILEWCCLFSLGHDHFINEILKFPLTSLGPPSLLGLKVQNFVFLDKEFRLKELGFQ